MLGWVLVFGVMAVAVHPEDCRAPSAAEIDRASGAAVGWLAANIEADGRILYRYDRDRGVDEGGYNEPRHAGVLWSLFQAERAGVPGAAGVADRGLSWALDRIQDTPIGPAFGEGARLLTGSSALLLAALDERRLLTADTQHDLLMIELGQTLEAAINDEGVLDASIHRDTGPLGDRSAFFPGEVLWALARLHITFPDEQFDEPALRLGRYIVEQRDEVERPWPPISDHWAAYAFETMDRWPDAPSIDSPMEAWIDRQLGLLGLQVRYESQRVGGITTLTRGPNALGAGVGTLGEGIGNWLELDSRTGLLGDDRDVLAERGACAVGLLVDRQARSDDPRIDGAWFRLGDTQMDDQQHALSALLLMRGHLPA